MTVITQRPSILGILCAECGKGLFHVVMGRAKPVEDSVNVEDVRSSSAAKVAWLG